MNKNLPSSAKPLFVSFEGIEGSGKSTQAKILYDFLKQKEYPVILTREPGGTAIGNNIREILIDKQNNKISPITELLLNFASRAQHLQELILPALKNNQIVITDRFYDSTLAYQGFGMGIETTIIEKLHQITINSIEPDITFLFLLPVEEAFQRIGSRAENNRYEALSLDFHHKVYNGFLQIAKNNPHRFRIIDASDTIDNIAKKITEEIVQQITL